jgi:biopolymer transport protein TolR
MAFSMNQSQKTAMSEINVTPLVDVMLVLLIIFMVTAPMMQEGVTVELPQAKGTPLEKEQEKSPLVISVSDNGSVFLNDAPVKEETLPDKIMEATKENPSREVYLRADKSVPYGTVVRIMAALKGAGIANLGMITTPKQDGSGTK